MNAEDYEQFVADVVRNISFSANARVYKNRRYQGVRQPGSYEIDISCEFWLDNALFLHLIVECKNWRRPIGRQEVQKLAQTRDAISAHKAAFASPVGYTSEAVQVAKANGIALWVLAEGIFDVSAGGGHAALSVCFMISDYLRHLSCDALGSETTYGSNLTHRSHEHEHSQPKRPCMIPLSWLEPPIKIDYPDYPYFWAVSPEEASYDPILGMLVRFLFEAERHTNSATRAVHTEVSHIHKLLQKAGLDPTQAASVLYDFAIPMVTRGISVPGLFNKIDSLDRTVHHATTKLLAPIPWITKNMKPIVVDEGAGPSFLSLRANIVWVNAAWLLSKGR